MNAALTAHLNENRNHDPRTDIYGYAALSGALKSPQANRKTIAKSYEATVNEIVNVYLELIATKAKQLAEDSKRGQLWPGDMYRRLSEIREALINAESASRDDR